jgi:hypothetical protein
MGGSTFFSEHCPARASLDLEHIAILSAGAAGLAGLPLLAAAVMGSAVYLLIALAAVDAPTVRRLSMWQIGPWRTIVGAAFVGA